MSLAAAYDFDDDKDFLSPAVAWSDWHSTMMRANAERDVLQRCLIDVATCTPKLRSLRVILERGADLPRDQQLQLVNRWVNKHRNYRRDKYRKKSMSQGERVVRSQWSTLIEFLEKGGDCEDYATAKYLILRELGFPPEEVRVVVVFDRRQRDHHAVVGVRNEAGGAFLLDIDNNVYRRRPPHYRYVYAVNELGVWNHSVAVRTAR